MPRPAAAAVVVVAVLGLTGCCDESTCGACPDSVALTVVDAETGGAIEDLRLTVEGDEERELRCFVADTTDAASGSSTSNVLRRGGAGALPRRQTARAQSSAALRNALVAVEQAGGGSRDLEAGRRRGSLLAARAVTAREDDLKARREGPLDAGEFVASSFGSSPRNHPSKNRCSPSISARARCSQSTGPLQVASSRSRTTAS